MEFRILGPLEVVAAGRPVPLPRKKSRGLLALLLLRANQVVSTDHLVDALWGDDPPKTAVPSLHNAVSDVRRALGADRVVSQAPGYRLRVEPDELDLARFERLAAEAAAAAEPETRAARLREALVLWRGEPLADLADEPFAREEVGALEELRTAATEDRIDADLELGRAAELVPELERLIAANPLRERLRSQLMLALYRAGRQAEALEEYRAARTLLREELGLEPSEELQRLERAILRQDPGLTATVRAGPRSFEPARKLVTTLVVEVSAPGSDPERLRLATERIFDEVRTAVERHGGRVHAVREDALTALFGAPLAREDDALRAVRAADETRSLAREDTIELRAALDSGDTLVRDAAVTGDAVANAHRLLEVADAGEVVMGSATAALVRDNVDVERIPAAHVRRRAVDAFRLVAVEPRGDAVPRNLDVPLVGRRHELERLREELRLVISERRCRIVTLVGEAGIGKSRLARELTTRATNDATVLSGRCVSYGEGATYLPLADVVRSAAHEPTTDAIAALLDGDPDAELAAEYLAALVGLTDAVVPGGDAFWAVRRFLEALARRRPLLVLFDDLHWAEPTFLDLVEHLRDWVEDAPLLLVCATRPELLDSRPSLGASAVVLAALDADEARTLVENTGVEMTEEDRERVVGAAEGNPLFVEHLVAAIAEGGARTLPASIEALIAARLDRLDARDRALLQRAAVVGRDFDAAVLAGLFDAEEDAVEGRLARLARRGLVRARGPGWRFHHALVREAAYAGTPKELRAELHLRYVELVTTDEVVGFHLERAHAYQAVLGAPDSAVARRAAEHLGRAGMRAFARGDAPAAGNLLERSIALLPDRDAQTIELQCELGIVSWIAGRDDATSLLHEAHAAAVETGDRRLEQRALVELAFVGLYGPGDTDARRAIDIARKAIPTLEEFEDDRALGRAWYLVALVEGSFFCRNAESIDAIDRAIHHYRRAAFPPSVCVAHLAGALFHGPTPVVDAVARCRSLLASAEAGRNGHAVVRMWLAALEARLGKFAAARALLDDATNTYRQLGQAGSIAGAESVRAEVELLASDYEAATRHLTDACESYQRLGLTPDLATAGAHLADVLHARGLLSEAERWLETAETQAEPSDVSAQFTCKSVRAKLLAARGDAVSAGRLAREAVELVDSTDALDQRARVRMALAHVLEHAGRHDEAAAVRTSALELFEAKGNVVAAAAAREALARVPA